ncbi:MAG: ABC transporter ATP-binding protein [Caldiserica bacterium]|nr:ABC transporter ATP-binding protein [Caldisericota bacterium]
MAKVVLENVTKRYGKVMAVNNVSLEAEDKEFLVLLGPSGCGKTTTLRMIAGLELADEGKVIIGDDVVNDVPPAARDIAMVFQNYALYPHMTVRDNISFGLKLHNIPAAEINERVADAAHMLGLQDYLKRVPKELSGGQRQRVALARAIVRKPKVFLMDEPLSNLDAKLRVQTREELIKLHQTLGVTTIYVTHDQVEAMTLGSRVAVMENGFLRQIGKPRQVYDNPTNKFVAGFVGTPPSNFVPVDLVLSPTPSLDIEGQHVQLSAGQQKAAKSVSAGSYTWGVRPEDLLVDLQSNMPEVASTFNARISFVEMMGSETFIHTNLAGAPVVVRASSALEYAQGETVKLVVNVARTHLFHTDSGEVVF